MGRAIRYVPYPVVGGFLAATGCLILLGAVRVITGQRLQYATLHLFANSLTLYELAAACAMALVLYLTWHRSRTPFGLPTILIVGTLAAHVAFWLAGISSREAQVPELSGNFIAVIFVTASSTLFNTKGVEVAAYREANLERELNVTGVGNLLSGVFGGYTGCISVGRTVLNFNAGGSGRLSGLTAAAISAPARLHAEIRA